MVKKDSESIKTDKDGEDPKGGKPWRRMLIYCYTFGSVFDNY